MLFHSDIRRVLRSASGARYAAANCQRRSAYLAPPPLWHTQRLRIDSELVNHAFEASSPQHCRSALRIPNARVHG
ncbi:hypothetical protein PsYK624_160620 [Phanerochaete sordida]|uniref:Uncharacterized protein n=1 Tax=Phanerochaete sordida TaxID=48140 RepID=A0A9P3LLR2_9APHY|nr:hypothetical protein PsYK624_160620 [Phanerochaete sordida]